MDLDLTVFHGSGLGGTSLVNAKLVYEPEPEVFDAAKLGARWMEHPTWNFSPWKTLVTVHPLEGCPMGESAAEGMVDHRRRVFDGAGGAHQGLYVTDGSLLSAPVGSNPFWAISVLTDRVVDQLIADLGGTA